MSGLLYAVTFAAEFSAIQVASQEAAMGAGCLNIYQESYIQYSQPEERAARKAGQDPPVEWVYPLFMVTSQLESTILEEMSKQDALVQQPILNQVLNLQ